MRNYKSQCWTWLQKGAISKFCFLKRLTLLSFITYLLEPSVTLEPCLTRKAILRVVYPNLAKSVIHHLLLSLITFTSGNYLPWDNSVCCGVIIYYVRESTHLYTASKSSRGKNDKYYTVSKPKSTFLSFKHVTSL